jgi:hypothetical protein
MHTLKFTGECYRMDLIITVSIVRPLNISTPRQMIIIYFDIYISHGDYSSPEHFIFRDIY